MEFIWDNLYWIIFLVIWILVTYVSYLIRPQSLRAWDNFIVEYKVDGNNIVSDDVTLGLSAPTRVKKGTEFTARFIAYTDSLEKEIESKLEKLSPRSNFYPEIRRCNWRYGTEIKVKCYGNYLDVQPVQDIFVWKGNYNIIDFDVIVSPSAKDELTILKFDVLIDEIVIARLRLDLKISHKQPDKTIKTIKSKPYHSAFASYASEDRLRVLDRISEIQRNGVNVFLDCLSINPGEEWKPRLEKEIKTRELFLLFWSNNAKQSEWVDWEWRTAYKHKGISGIDPHPLDPVLEAKPPEELQSLHFGDPHVLIRKAFEKEN